MDYKSRAKELVSQMTLEEKAKFSSGADLWNTVAIERLGIPAICMTDGPHGLRLAKGGAVTDLSDSVPATCFPTASALASSWNTELAGRVGEAIAAECQANGVQVVLGPGVNMKRSPLGGRNFEYYSEDPILSGTMAAAQIKGAESKGVGTSLKHYAANEQEYQRMTTSSEVEEETLHEVTLRAFELAIKEAKPWSVMVSYNKLNGTYATESSELLRNILRERWGYEGVVLSDWGAAKDRVASLKAGLQLEMPGPGTSGTVIEAVQNGTLDESVLDESVAILLEYVLAIDASRAADAHYDAKAHHTLARDAARESIVLLKNDADFLPITPEKHKTVALIGRFAKEPRYQGSGSSQIAPTQLSNVFDALRSQLEGQTQLIYAPGYDEEGNTSEELLKEAATVAGDADAAIVFAGLPGSAESEGFDRQHMDLPEGHNQLIDEVAKTKKPCGVVLMNGAAVTMPWVDNVQAVVEAWLTGQAGGDAVADILSGAVNPSGKLSETFPQRIEDTPVFPYFPARNNRAIYGEGVFVGYRHYDAHKITPLFPFGFGLSYTSFNYESIEVSKESLTDEDTVEVTVTVRNNGQRAGKETVQLYVAPGNADPTLSPQPIKTLQAFQKLHLEPGEQKTHTFTLSFRNFAFYDVTIHDWRIAAGNFTILAGSSSADLPLRKQLAVAPKHPFVIKVTPETPIKKLGSHPQGKEIYDFFASQIPETLLPVVQDLPLDRLYSITSQLSEDTVQAIVAYCNDPEHTPNPLKGAIES